MKKRKKVYRADPEKYQRELAGRRLARKRNPEKAKRQDRKRSIKTNFGITESDYAYLFQKQGGTCAICGKPETAILNGKTKRLAIDHCHDTGAIRGLLCSLCNRALGCFRNDVDILARAMDYVLRPIDPRMVGIIARGQKEYRR